MYASVMTFLYSLKWSTLYRSGIEEVLEGLGGHYNLHLLSGDNDKAATKLAPYFGADQMHFHQKPEDKLAYVQQLQQKGRSVLMVGDGLNDAGALKASNVGLSVAEDIYGFSPACDGILDAGELPGLPRFLRFSQAASRVLKYSLVFSLVYNLIGLSFAISNELTPLVAAVIMPLSSISVVLLTTLGIRLYAGRIFVKA